MGKGSRAKNHGKGRCPLGDAALSTTEAQVAARHTFGAGLLGHDFTASQWLVNVSESTALGIDAVFACVRLVCDAVAGSDVAEYVGDLRLDEMSPLVRQPDPDQTQWEFLWGLTATLMLYNAAWVQRATIDGQTIAIRYISPSRVSEVGGSLLVDAKAVDRSTMKLVKRAVFPTVNVEFGQILTLAREVFAAEMAAGAYRSDFWQQGGAPVTVLTSDQVVPNEVADAVSAKWVELRTTSPGKPAVMSRGVKPMAFGADLGTEGANVAGDKLKASVARFLGVPPFLINVASEAGSLTYSTTEQEGIHFVKYTVWPYCKIEGDLLGSYLPGDIETGRRVKIDPRRFTEAEQLSRYQSYQLATGGAAWLDVEEVRKKEGYAPGAPEPATPEVANVGG